MLRASTCRASDDARERFSFPTPTCDRMSMMEQGVVQDDGIPSRVPKAFHFGLFPPSLSSNTCPVGRSRAAIRCPIKGPTSAGMSESRATCRRGALATGSMLARVTALITEDEREEQFWLDFEPVMHGGEKSYRQPHRGRLDESRSGLREQLRFQAEAAAFKVRR